MIQSIRTLFQCTGDTVESPLSLVMVFLNPCRSRTVYCSKNLPTMSKNVTEANSAGEAGNEYIL